MLPACDYDLISMVSDSTSMIHSICLQQLKFYVRIGLVHCLGHVTQGGRLAEVEVLIKASSGKPGCEF